MSEWHLNLWSGISAWDESGRRLITNISKLCWVWLLNILKEVCLHRERGRKEGGKEGRKLTRKEAALSGSGTPAGAGREFHRRLLQESATAKVSFQASFLSFLIVFKR